MLERTRSNFLVIFLMFPGRVDLVVQNLIKSEFLPQRAGFPVPGPYYKNHYFVIVPRYGVHNQKKRKESIVDVDMFHS